MDLFTKIRQEHKQLLEDIDNLIGADPSTHRAKLDDLTVCLMAHWNAEEQSIYQEFEELDAVPRSLAMRHEQEHHVLRLLLAELQEKVYNDEVWFAKLQVFKFLAEHHVESEERTMFDMAGDYFNEVEVRRMTVNFERVEADLYKSSRIKQYVER